MRYVIILLIVMPITELAILLRVGDWIGWMPALLIVITTAIVGSAMLRHQGLATMNKAKDRMDSGEMPAQQVIEGLFLVVGGVLLLTPGFFTDTCGFMCLIPFTRRWMVSKLSPKAIDYVNRKAEESRVRKKARAEVTSSKSAAGSVEQRKFSGTTNVIDGDYKPATND